MSKYINPFTDFGFKYIFGQEAAKPFLIDFLNEVLKNEPGFEPIEDVTYLDKEKSKLTKEERGIIYDILCRSIDGREFIVEMQNAAQSYFIDRGIYYSARAISSQGETGDEWNFDLRPVYNISFLNFKLNDFKGKVRTDAAVCELETGKPISDKMRFIFIQLPEFNVEEDDCKNIFDQWIYILKNMDSMKTFPFTSERKLYRQLADRASYASLSVDERRLYDSELKAYRDYHNQLDYRYKVGHAEGHAEGREEGIVIGAEKKMFQMARKMKERGYSDEEIAEVVELTPEQLSKILNKKVCKNK